MNGSSATPDEDPTPRPRLGMICVPSTVRLAVEMARALERGGLWGMGVGDSQARYMEVYSVAAACLLGTKRLAVGPIVTNPMTRHWTVHAAAARALDEIGGGRYVVGFSSGNSSVRAIGRPPSASRAVEEAITHMREQIQARVPVLVAADGPRMARVAGRCADGIIIGTGLDAAAVASLWQAAVEARREAGVARPLEGWLSTPLHVVETEQEVAAARVAATGVAISMARRSLADHFDGKQVPAAYQAILRDRLPRYDMRHHGAAGANNPNAQLLADYPEVEAYVANRFGIVGTPEQCRARLQGVIRDTGVRNVWFSSVVPDPVRNAELAAVAFRPLIGARASQAGTPG